MDNIIAYKDKKPIIDDSAHINPYAMLVGAVIIRAGVSVWPNVIIRAGDGEIRIGENTTILDRTFIEASPGRQVNIGNNVLISHGVTMHGCNIENNVLIGRNANILEGAEIGEGSVIASGAVVDKKVRIPPRSKVSGIPAKVTGQVTDEELDEVMKKHDEILSRAGEYGSLFVTKHI